VGVKPDDILVYVLVGYDHKKKAARPIHEDDIFRVRELVAFGARPYPMPFVRPAKEHGAGHECPRCRLGRQLCGFLRWATSAHAKRGTAWETFEAARYQPRNLAPEGDPAQAEMFA
jgi:hypothetical protein